MSKVTIKDIAKGAGVSISTVSYVLSGKRSVSEEVKKKIYEQIELLNYKPDAVARSFKSRKTNIIGLYCAKKTDTLNTDIFFLKMISGMMDAAEKRNYKILVLNEMEASENFVIPIDKTFPIDGAVVTGTMNSQLYLNQLQSENIPFVLIGKPPKDMTINYIDNDNVKAAYQAVEALIKKDVKSIGMVTDSGMGTRISDFEIGYMMAHNDYQIPYKSEHIIRFDVTKPSYVESIIERIKHYKLDGVLVSLLFNKLINQLLTNPLIANDITTVSFGFDLVAEHYQYLNKPLDYIESNAYRLGSEAIATLIEVINNPEAETTQSLLPPVITTLNSAIGN
ncbi:LacI family DNA-binding transcriptional regulator [Cohnella faecalis]|uniref:LacI family DNA-binding transcriptional regulator n=1 Tax=Cohnella faecalis TaxID=2315694 RepID=UPI0036071B5B